MGSTINLRGKFMLFWPLLGEKPGVLWATGCTLSGWGVNNHHRGRSQIELMLWIQTLTVESI